MTTKTNIKPGRKPRRPPSGNSTSSHPTTSFRLTPQGRMQLDELMAAEGVSGREVVERALNDRYYHVLDPRGKNSGVDL
jgi:hypothetical protein